MTPFRRRLVPLALAGFTVLTATSCSSRPTYPKAQLAATLQTLLKQERVNATVRLVDHTLAVQSDYPDALVQKGAQIGIGPAFDEVTRKVLINVHRVLLSSDAQVNFYVLLISDPKTPGVYITMVRYMDDVRKASANMLADTEMFSRTLFDLNVVGPVPLTIEQYVPRDIHLEEFLSWQLARRIQRKLTEEFQDAGIAQVGRCGGEFRDGEFAFTLNIAPASESPLDDETLRKVFLASTDVVASVLSSYRFESFDHIRLIHPPTGRNLVLPKGRLPLFR